MAADILDFPPPVTGRVESHEEYWHRQAQNLRREVSAEWGKRLKAERERDTALDRLDDYVEAIAEGRLIGPAAFWARMALGCGGFLLIGYCLGVAM